MRRAALPVAFATSLVAFGAIVFFICYSVYTTAGRFKFTEEIEKRRQEGGKRVMPAMTGGNTLVTFAILIGIPLLVSGLITAFCQSPTTSPLPVFILSMTLTVIITRYAYKTWYVSTVERHWIGQTPKFLSHSGFDDEHMQEYGLRKIGDVGNSSEDKHWDDKDFEKAAREYSKLAFKYHKLEAEAIKYLKDNPSLPAERIEAIHRLLGVYKMEVQRRLTYIDNMATGARSVKNISSAIVDVLRIMVL